MGCLVRKSSLSAMLGLPYPFECTTDMSNVEDYRDVEKAAREASIYLSGVLGVKTTIAGFRGWEYLGGRFNLFSFELEGSRRTLGILRVVESGGYIINITGALLGMASVEVPLLEELRGDGEYYSEGEVLDLVMLKRPSNPGRESMPPGQKAVPKFIIYAAEGLQRINAGSWRLRIEGSVEKPLDFTYVALLELASDRGQFDFHCVTGWSVMGRLWEGISLKHLIHMARPNPGAKWAAFVSTGGYSTIVPLEDVMEDGNMVALLLDGKPLPKENGYPARILLPWLYGWKHAKWVERIILLDKYVDGYWEALSYHERGSAILEERFKVRNVEIAQEGRLLGKPRPLKH
ncbi:molybdopterin-dependent oxidoreductase [Aeropyrum camini]|uniref:Sulfite oxidase n=1 Tax=Aeropyrum camini SY1 = JCM 12091 TaxID=1198449 RepID=U3TC46_9CREN|nr:molybdopterin-dependent oxidoreductase [Aeropyrum camini]BAN89523.1 sulfite oxidase [Aeropyrum camini SY1 = JCM 12091]